MLKKQPAINATSSRDLIGSCNADLITGWHMKYRIIGKCKTIKNRFGLNTLMFGMPFFSITLLIALVLLVAPSKTSAQLPADYVILISVDGLRSDAITNLGSDLLPNIYRLQTEGAYTNNARNDYDITITLPNHVTEVTSRGILGVDDNGHKWTINVDPAPDQTIHSNKGSYVASVFDVVHDNGLTTALYAGKTKFSLFDVSYNGVNGADDVTGTDNGKDKIDYYLCNSTTSGLINSCLSDMQSNPYNFTMIHILDLDSIGHSSGWDSDAYYTGLRAVDGYLGSILDVIESDNRLVGRTSIIFTADHGGQDYNHSDATLPAVYTIPLYVWGRNVDSGIDLYDLNVGAYNDPATYRPAYTDAIQPIRNGDAGNLALSLLYLPAIPGSTLNSSQTLRVSETDTYFNFDAAVSKINESDSTATITVTRTWASNSSENVSVAYSTSNGSAQAALDYTATTGTLTWLPGDVASKTFTVPIIDDNDYEGNETIILTLSDPSLGAGLGRLSTVALTIVDNETPPPPAAPNTLVAKAVSASQIDLSWTDNSSDHDGFYISRSIGAVDSYERIATVSANVTTYQDTGLSASTTYYYQIQAYNAYGASSTIEDNETTFALPAAPMDLVATAFSTNQINLSWVDSSDNETGFRIERSNTGIDGSYVQIATLDTGATSYQDMGLSGSTLYYYRVQAFNSAGDSDYTNVASATTLALPPAAPMRLIATTVSSSQINLTWTDKSRNEDGFKIERSDTDINGSYVQIATVGANIKTYTNTGLSGSKLYCYRVQAFNSGGDSAYSNVASATTSAAPSVTPVTYNPYSYTLVTGTSSSGRVNTLMKDDNKYLIISSQTTDTGSQAITDFTVTGITANSPSTVDIKVIAKSSRAANQTIYLCNYLTGQWDLIDNSSILTAENTCSIELTDALSYISSGGELKLRCDALTNEITTFKVSYELIAVTVTP